MKQKVTFPIFLLILLSLMIAPVFAETILSSENPTIPTPPQENQYTEAEKLERQQQFEQRERLSMFLLLGSIFISIVVGIISMALMIKKESFSEKRRYILSLTLGWIIAAVLGVILLIINAFSFSWDGLGVGIMLALILAFYTIGFFILGIIGFFIDRYHNKKNTQLSSN